jgi:hypothetical protein
MLSFFFVKFQIVMFLYQAYVSISDNHYLEKVLHVPELVIVWNHTIINFISDKFKRIVSVREIHSGHHEVITEIDKGKTKVSKLVATHVFQRHLS